MEPIKVVQLLNLSNEALNMKSGEIGLSAFRCDQHVIGIVSIGQHMGQPSSPGPRICQILASRSLGEKKESK